MYLPLISGSDIRTPVATRDQFHIAVDDAIILPMVVIAFLARIAFQAACLILAVAATFAFCLLLRAMTSLLLVAATAGTAMAWLLKRLADPGRKLREHQQHLDDLSLDLLRRFQ